MEAPRVDALRELARREDSTLFMVLLAGFDAWLHRYTGQDDLVVGTPVAGRTRREIEPLIGCFLNSLPMRARIAPGLRFPELLDQARRTALDAFAHQDLPFERLVEALAPERNLSHPPIFQVLFNFLNVPPRTEGLPGGVRLRAGTVQSGTTRFDLELYMEEQEQGLIIALVYNTDLFDAATTARLLSHLEVLLHGVAERPDEALAALPLLAPAESHQLLREWNDTAAEPPERPGVHQLFAAQARRTPDAPAAIFQETSLTYAELASRASQLAGHLRRLGCGPETRVAVALERCLDMPVALLGVLEAGSAYVPLDPDYPSERLALVLEDAAPRVLITRERLLSALPPVPGRVLCLDGELTPGGPSGPDGQPPFHDLQLAYTLYTSGSTGRPKGVEVPHRTLVNFLGSMRRTPGFAPGERLLAVTSLAFDIAALEIFLPLTTGGCVELASREEAADGVLLAARLQASEAGVMQATPATWRMLLDSGWTGDPGLRALCGGEALPRDLAAVLAGRTRELWNLYGPTETTVWSAAARLHPEESGPVSIGRPIAETRIYLLDRTLETVPLGVPGELYIGGAGLARGYLGRPDLTADRFVPDPLATAMEAPGGRLYRTGDLARHLPGGRMEVLGRIDHQVKVRGFRIELGEIEATLTRHPGIREAVVVLREGSLVAYLVAAGEMPAAGELRDVLRRSLPEPMVPAVFVPLSALPL
ncbi:MAG TPA: amino acid adenylation domain-containing protein, partial [Thermoanaerobaculia bacterium]|nr:amino acid adenylation domain-containing protein [Thermoanaerobaculia bacterium]